jgi:hypothetical protein
MHCVVHESLRVHMAHVHLWGGVAGGSQHKTSRGVGLVGGNQFRAPLAFTPGSTSTTCAGSSRR